MMQAVTSYAALKRMGDEARAVHRSLPQRSRAT